MVKFDSVREIFLDGDVTTRIKNKLPKLFHIAELESSRAGKVGMEVGSLRERVIVALLIYLFGKDNVATDVPITKSEIDVMVKNIPYSIKTITGTGGIKAVWTVDAKSAFNFINNYKPKCDIILAQIAWGYIRGGFNLIPLEVQKEVYDELGKEKYLKMPKAGTNPRGVEFSKEAIEKMLSNKNTLNIPINWKKEVFEYDGYKKWIEYWTD